MITGKDFYQVVSAVVPLYFAMLLGYGSVKWWRIFTPDQCAGINRFVAVFAVPLLSFGFIYNSDLYNMNFLFIAADSLQKLVILAVLFLVQVITKSGLDWTITVFSLAALPNTLVVGVPLMTAMYGESTSTLMVQIVVLQVVIWYSVILFMYEYRSGRQLMAQQFLDTAAPISSVKIGSDVVSLSGRRESLEAETEMDEDGKLHLVLRNSSFRGPRVSDLSGVEVFSVQSSMQKSSSVNNADLHADFAAFDSFHVAHQPDQDKDSADLQVEGQEGQRINSQMPPPTVMTKLILVMVWRKLVRNPNTYASILGLVWALIAFRWNIKMPLIITGCIKILSNTGLGMATFSLGLFSSSQPKIIACGKKVAFISMVIKFLVGPLVMAATSAAIGVRGNLLRIAIVQAALPLGIVPFIFAKEYNLHTSILSTGVIFGMFISLPVTVIYYVLLGL
ncbi:hypothetical protein Tsubulata_047535 [Turnera subulata]|uniref:Auxin efflux carrier component n=1 Tax=Turnera subulata TaxID=218843 RepID=A0A9Q0GKM4_9ROSI|nr:hypothetical protein Tsubulata_047535 [Turnera subulata]